MGNQNGTVADGRDPNQRGGAGHHGGHQGGGHPGGPHHGGGGGGAAQQAEKAQRRATSSGVPSRSRGKAHRNANSTVNPPTSPSTTHPAAQVQSAANIGTDVDHGTSNKSPTHASNEFVDFIYDYATKNEDSKDPPAPPPKKLYQEKNDRQQTPDVPERRHGRERARAHTHGHAQRKQKHAAQKAANHKSQLVTDYMDAGSGLTSSLTVPNLAMGNDSDPHSDDSLSQKVAELKNAGRERARAHSHGHRKQKPGDKQKQNKINNHDNSKQHHVSNTSAQSVPEIAAAIAAENGHGIYASNRSAQREEEQESHYDTPKRQHLPPDGPEMPYEDIHVQEINEPIPDSVPELIAEVKKLRNSNAKLRRELIDAKKAVEKDARK